MSLLKEGPKNYSWANTGWRKRNTTIYWTKEHIVPLTKQTTYPKTSQTGMHLYKIHFYKCIFIFHIYLFLTSATRLFLYCLRLYHRSSHGQMSSWERIVDRLLFSFSGSVHFLSYCDSVPPCPWLIPYPTFCTWIRKRFDLLSRAKSPYTHTHTPDKYMI